METQFHFTDIYTRHISQSPSVRIHRLESDSEPETNQKNKSPEYWPLCPHCRKDLDELADDKSYDWVKSDPHYIFLLFLKPKKTYLIELFI